jgi:CRP-like cAMP-binding protein
LFADLSKKDLGFLAQLSTEASFSEGTYLVTEGNLGREDLILMSGKAVVRRNGRKVAELAAGDVVGEMSLINQVRRNATATTTSDVRRQRSRHERP